MAYCVQCGKEAPAGGKFCKYCGAPQESVAPPEEDVAETVPQPDERYIYSGAASEHTYAPAEPPSVVVYPPVVAEEPGAAPGAKKRRALPLALALVAVLALGGVVAGLLYDGNYKKVLAAIGVQVDEGGEEDTTDAAQSRSVTQTTAAVVAATAPATQTAPPTQAPTAPPTQPDVPGATHRVATAEGSPLRLRSGPDTAYPQVEKIPNGTSVIVTRTQGNWAYVTYNGVAGWCSLDFLLPIF
ncbi:MAG: SH3 domain-containing protein [Oscillospiraceae bacterium]|jgi:hypothetical protein|nr:SH3 domain-containing protein [Oscillospiraceae bacterium]